MSKGKLFNDFPPIIPGQFKEQIIKDLKGKDFGAVLWRTIDEMIFEPFYSSEDLKNSEAKGHQTGSYPFLRGNQKYGNHWEIRQDIQNINPKEANKKALDILNKGVTSLGFNVELEKINELLDGVLVEFIETNFTVTSNHLELLKAFLSYTSQRNLNPLQVKGSINYQPLAGLLTGGSLDTNWEAGANAIATELIDGGFTFFRGININGSVFHNAGASIVQELAFTLAQGNEYLVSLSNKHKIDELAPILQFTYSTGSSYLLEIAKLRAARLLWARIIEQYKPTHDCTSATYIHCQTSEWTLSVADAYNNLLRATTQAMSAAIGGANSITVTPFDAAIKEPEEFSERLARNIQIICAEEAFLNKVADPAGGSYYIEKLTESIAQAAWDLFRLVESKGGYIAACREGFIQEEIQKTANARKEAVASGNTVIVGVNKYINKQEDISQQLSPEANAEETEKEFRILKKFRIAEVAERDLVMR
jgi:methylmalonyl-CoA mutase